MASLRPENLNLGIRRYAGQILSTGVCAPRFDAIERSTPTRKPSGYKQHTEYTSQDDDGRTISIPVAIKHIVDADGEPTTAYMTTPFARVKLDLRMLPFQKEDGSIISLSQVTGVTLTGNELTENINPPHPLSVRYRIASSRTALLEDRSYYTTGAEPQRLADSPYFYTRGQRFFVTTAGTQFEGHESIIEMIPVEVAEGNNVFVPKKNRGLHCGEWRDISENPDDPRAPYEATLTAFHIRAYYAILHNIIETFHRDHQ